MKQDEEKKLAAEYALRYVHDDAVVGVGTGSTVNYFIAALAKQKHLIEAAVASSEQTLALLQEHKIATVDANSVPSIDVYIDGADEATKHLQLIKGGGAALTGEKILRAMSKQFVCVVDSSKMVGQLGSFAVPVEVIPMARSYVAREIVKLGGDPVYRDGVRTDYGNVILDVHNLKILDPQEVEQRLQQITGVVTVGLFAKKPADTLVLATGGKVQVLRASEALP